MSEQTPTPEEAARRAADPDYLMPGEQADVRGDRAADAVHWLSVYGELLAFKEELLSVGRSHMTTMSEDARQDARTDEVLLAHQAERYRRRIAFWTARLTALQVAEGDGHVGSI